MEVDIIVDANFLEGCITRMDYVVVNSVEVYVSVGTVQVDSMLWHWSEFGLVL